MRFPSDVDKKLSVEDHVNLADDELLKRRTVLYHLILKPQNSVSASLVHIDYGNCLLTGIHDHLHLTSRM